MITSIKRDLPPYITDLYIDECLNVIYEIVGCQESSTASIVLPEKPKFKAKQLHNFAIKTYRNDKVLREFLDRTIEFTGEILSVKVYHDSPYEMEVSIIDDVTHM